MSDSCLGFLQRSGRIKVIPEIRMRIIPEDIVHTPRGVEYPFPILEKQCEDGINARSDSVTHGWPYPE